MKTLSQIITKQIEKLKKELPKVSDIVAKESVNWFKQSFNNSGFTNESLQAWRKRRRQYKHRILWKSGALRRSIRIKRLIGSDRMVISDLPYSSIHNYGGNGLAWGKHPFKMPRRRFLGESKRLHRLMNKRIQKELIKRVF